MAAGTNGNHLTGLDVTASVRPPGRARTEIMLDEDGYAEIRWHTNPAAPAAEVATALARAIHHPPRPADFMITGLFQSI